MTFNANTVVAECIEDSTVPSIKYDFVAISDIASKTPDSLLGKLFIPNMFRFHNATYRKSVVIRSIYLAHT